jgi:hypothetical protein
MCASGLRSGRARVGLINRAADLAISPVSDERQWGVADHWSDPFETLCPIAVTVRITRSSNTLRCWRQAFPRTM